MPIDASPSGTLDIENATLRSRNIASLTNMVAGNDVIRGSAAPTLEVYGDPSHGGSEPTLELVSNTSNTVSTTFTRLTSNAGVFSIQSGTVGTADSKADITFASIGGNTEHMRIKGSSGNVGIGTANPGQMLSIYTGSTTKAGLSIDRYPTGNYRTEFYQADTGLAIRVGNNTNVPSEKMRIKHDGKVGIGTTDPSYILHVHGSGHSEMIQTTGAASKWCMLKWVNNTTTWEVYNYNGDSRWRWWSSLANKDVAYVDALNGNIGGRLNFTGQHRTFIKDVPFSQAGDLEGLIVSSDQNKYIKMSGGIEAGSNAITTNESLPIVSISTISNDKKCFGVISTSEDPETREEAYGSFVSVSQKEIGDTRVYINSVGEGAIWVTNINGSLESGDYITTSNVAGYGQKQDSEFLANYTVAKITMDCDFNPVTQPVQNIKKEMGEVKYWFKTTYENVTEEEYSNLTDENRRIVDGIYQKITKEESKTEREGYELEVRQELVNILDEHGQIQWENDPSGATEKAYKIRYLDADGNITDEANAVHIAAFVGCTYHCG